MKYILFEELDGIKISKYFFNILFAFLVILYIHLLIQD